MASSLNLSLPSWYGACRLQIPPWGISEFEYPYSSILAWRIPGMGEPGGLPSMGLHRVGHNWSDLAAVLYTEKAMAPHSSTLAWKIPCMEEPGRLQSMGLLRVGHDRVTSLSLFTFMHWRRKWQPTPRDGGAWWAAVYGVAQSRTRLKRRSSSSSSKVALVVKNLLANARDMRDTGSIPGSGRSLGGGHGNPLQYSCPEKPIDRGDWWATVYGVAKSQTWLKWLSMDAQGYLRWEKKLPLFIQE